MSFCSVFTARHVKYTESCIIILLPVVEWHVKYHIVILSTAVKVLLYKLLYKKNSMIS